MRTGLTLDEIGSGERVFADATVFIYHFAGASTECKRLLERCERGDVKVVTSAATLAEVSHRLMMMEAVSLGMVSAGNVAKKLRKKSSAVKRLRSHHASVQQIPLMGVRVLPLDLRTILQASSFREKFGLMVNDSIMASTASTAGVEIMATSDRDFERVPELTVAIASDLESRES